MKKRRSVLLFAVIFAVAFSMNSQAVFAAAQENAPEIAHEIEPVESLDDAEPAISVMAAENTSGTSKESGRSSIPKKTMGEIRELLASG